MCTFHRSEVAKRLNKDCYGLVFGFNIFVALFLHTLITYGIVQGHFISVTTVQQVIKKSTIRLDCKAIKYQYNVSVGVWKQ